MRFWNQYEAEIVKSNINPVSKFSYLKELLIPSICVIIDALPLTYEGYERGKQILKSKYGKPSEIVNAGFAQLTLDKLEGIRADLVRMDDEWQDWDFTQL